MRKIILFLLLIVSVHANSQTIRILFDATKAESAGNADWVIDANLHNIGWNPNAQIGNGNEANAQQIPSPAQSTIIATTPETFWQGGISNWGIDCVKRGYQVETLPYNGSITYNNFSNPQDLSNYKVFVVCEPNILFTASEKTAILNYVQNGGSLFMVSDHDQSDRNGDGYDSPAIWNDLMSSNPFGIIFNLNDYSQSSTSVITTPTDSIANGPYGQVTQVLWTGGTDMTISTNVNPTVKGAVFKNGYLNNNTKVMFAYSRYGTGKVAAMGDSSPADDGSGDPNDGLYNGYILDAAGNHRKLIMNATVWLAASNSSVAIAELKPGENQIQIYCSQKNLIVKNNSSNDASIKIFDLLGNLAFENCCIKDMAEKKYSLSNLKKGIYFVKTISNQINITQKITITE